MGALSYCFELKNSAYSLVKLVCQGGPGVGNSHRVGVPGVGQGCGDSLEYGMPVGWPGVWNSLDVGNAVCQGLDRGREFLRLWYAMGWARCGEFSGVGMPGVGQGYDRGNAVSSMY